MRLKVAFCLFRQVKSERMWTYGDSSQEMVHCNRLLKLMASEAETEFEVVVGWSAVHDLLTVTESLLSGKTTVSA